MPLLVLPWGDWSAVRSTPRTNPPAQARAIAKAKAEARLAVLPDADINA
jgi:hypothetical protein